MKKLLYLLLLTPIIYLVSCSSGKDGLSPETMENTIVGKKWMMSNDVKGFYLSEDGKFYDIEMCGEDDWLGNWIIEDDLIKYRYYPNSQEVTILVGQVSEYTSTQIKLVDSSDPNMTVNTTYNAFTEVYGCTDSTAANYNQLANCDDGSCVPFIYGCTDSLALNYNPQANMDDGSCAFQATHTYIPDDRFEQLLIDLGYDNVLDDYVLTENIINVKKLELNVFGQNGSIVNLTGLESFASLEDIEIAGYVSSILDLSSNILLKRIYVNGQMGTTIDSLVLNNNLDLEELILCGNLFMKTLDLSTNSKLERLSIENTTINKIDLRNHSLVNLDIDLLFLDGSFLCISVDDVNFANSQWPYYFSEQCP
jgi:hypothetical protein